MFIIIKLKEITSWIRSCYLFKKKVVRRVNLEHLVPDKTIAHLKRKVVEIIYLDEKFFYIHMPLVFIVILGLKGHSKKFVTVKNTL